MVTNNDVNASTTAPLNNHKLPIKETLKEAWQNVHGFKASYWLAYIIMIIILFGSFALAIALSPGGFSALTTSPPQLHFTGLAIAIRIIGQLCFLLLMYGLFYIGLRRVVNLPIESFMIFSIFKYPRFLQLIGLYILKLLILIIAAAPFVVSVALFHFRHVLVSGWIYLISFMVLFIGYYYLLRLSLSTFAIVDKGINPIAAIKLSYKATKGNVLRILWISFLLVLILLVSMIPLLIGLIWTKPYVILVFSTIYKRLIGISMKD